MARNGEAVLKEGLSPERDLADIAVALLESIAGLREPQHAG